MRQCHWLASNAISTCQRLTEKAPFKPKKSLLHHISRRTSKKPLDSFPASQLVYEGPFTKINVNDLAMKETENVCIYQTFGVTFGVFFQTYSVCNHISISSMFKSCNTNLFSLWNQSLTSLKLTQFWGEY